MNKIARDFGVRTRKVLSIATALAFVTAGIQAPVAQAATATINNVSFKAPVYNSYDHTTGGGAWNDGSVTYDKGELLGTNFACGDFASFLLELNTSVLPTKQPAPYKVEVRLTYTWDSTGQSGVSLTPDLTTNHLKVNTGSILNTYQGGSSPLGTGSIVSNSDGGFNADGYLASVATTPAPYRTDSGTKFTSGATSAATFVVENVKANANVIVRSDAKIECKPGASPTGNLQAALTYVKVIAPGAIETISAGNQTVNFRGVGNLAGLTGPSVTSLTVVKAATTSTTCPSTPAGMPAQPLSVANNTAVTFCYWITNNTNVAATGVTVIDDRATPTNSADDFTPTVTWPGGVVGTIPGGQTATAISPRTTYTNGTINTNTVSVAAANANTTTATATVTTGTAPTLTVTKSLTSAAPTAAGDIVTYSVTVTNTGNSSVTAIPVTDPNQGSSSTANVVKCPSGTLASPNVIAKLGNGQGNNPPVSETCMVTHVVTTAEATAGKVLNTAYANGTYTSNTVVTYMPTMASPYELSVVKTQTSPTTAANVGNVVQYSVLITNISANSITNVTAADTLTTGPNATNGGTSATLTLTCATNAVPAVPVTLPTTLTSGASIVCTTSYTAVATDANYTLQNIVKVTSTQVPVTYSNVVLTPVGSQPSLSILKLQSSTAVPKAVGDVITYSITAANTGNVALTNVIISDANAVVVSCTSGSPLAGSHSSAAVSLGVGTSFDCDFQHVVTSADMATGNVDNFATASGLSGSTNVTASSDHVITPIAKISITKTTAATSYVDATNTLTYTITVTNTGQVDLTNVVVTDAKADANSLSCVGTGTPGAQTYTLASLVVNGSFTCTASYTLISADKAANVTIVNTASVTSTEATTQTASVTTPYVAPNAPDITISKTQTGAAPTKVGDLIHYSIVVTNSGQLALTNVVISDNNIDASTLICGTGTVASNVDTVASLAIGASVTCSATHTVTDAEMKGTPSQVVNTASVVTTELTTPHTSTVTTPLTPNPQATITKTQTGAAVAQAGDVIHYSIVVTNTGNETLTNVQVTDSVTGVNLTCPAGSPYVLAINESVTCTATYTVLSADVLAGIFTNTASVTATELTGSLSATASTNLTAAPSVSIVKSRIGSTALTEAGQIVSYQIVVTNNGNVNLSTVDVTDANVSSLTCTPPTAVTSLAVNATIVCTGNHTVTTNEVSAGHVLNIASVSSTTGSINQSSNLIDTPVVPPTPVVPAPSLAIAKSLTGIAPIKVGQAASYIITVTNNGDVTLTGVTVTDANAVLGACSVALPATLAVGASLTCAATHAVTDADMAAGKIDNSAVATSTTANLNRTSNVVTVPLAPAPALTIVKSLAGSAPSKVGDTITYNIVVTNSGNVTISSVTVADANAVLGACSPATPVTLAPAATISCAATHVVTEADMAAGKVDNVATATGTAAAGTLSASSGSSATGTPGALNVTSNVVTVPLTPAPAITISKHVTGSLPTTIGGFLHYIIVVTNTGNVPLHDVTVGDDNATITSCSPSNPASTLAIGDRITCSAKHALTEADAAAGKVINVATVSTKENVSASSGSEATGGASSNPSDPSTVNKSNEVVTPIIFKQQTIGKGTKAPGTIVLNLAGTKLKNPKLKQLAFTGGEEPATSDYGFFGALMILMALVLGARRWAKR